ncbi:MAG: MarR family transcriptional regulator [Propionibacteriaceae bacterium]|jgi:DNA-binding MarR family transcriptional regulator|nr:MarR family transcriptional regulator [Propionibacteriaceae bacterium]
MSQTTRREQLLEQLRALHEECFSSAFVAHQVDALVQHPITPQQLHLLGVVALSGPKRAAELAAILDVSAATVSGLLKRLAKAGLIARAVDPADARGRLAELTEAGQSFLRRLAEATVPPFSQAVDHLSTDDLAALVKALGPVVRAFQTARQAQAGEVGGEEVGAETVTSDRRPEG